MLCFLPQTHHEDPKLHPHLHLLILDRIVHPECVGITEFGCHQYPDVSWIGGNFSRSYSPSCFPLRTKSSMFDLQRFCSKRSSSSIPSRFLIAQLIPAGGTYLQKLIGATTNTSIILWRIHPSLQLDEFFTFSQSPLHVWYHTIYTRYIFSKQKMCNDLFPQ